MRPKRRFFSHIHPKWENRHPSASVVFGAGASPGRFMRSGDAWPQPSKSIDEVAVVSFGLFVIDHSERCGLAEFASRSETAIFARFT